MIKLPVWDEDGVTVFSLIDDEDKWVMRFKWGLSGRKYVGRWGRGEEVRTYFYLHDEIMKPPEDMEVDHIHGNTLDNRKSELRVCTRSQNLANMTKAYGKVAYKGVYLGPILKGGKRRFQVKVAGKHIGCFDIVEEAARAYDAAAIERFGEFAKTNKALGLIGG